MIINNTRATKKTSPRTTMFFNEIGIVIYASFICVVLVTFSLNAITIYVIAKNRNLRSKASNIFFLNLAIVDTGLAFDVFTSYNIMYFTSSVQVLIGGCIWQILMFLILFQASLLFIFVISVDRYIFITWPLRYHVIARPRTLWKISGVIWGFCIICASLPFIHDFRTLASCRVFVNDSVFKVLLDFQMSLFGCISFATLCIYILLLRTVRNHSKRLSNDAEKWAVKFSKNTTFTSNKRQRKITDNTEREIDEHEVEENFHQGDFRIEIFSGDLQATIPEDPSKSESNVDLNGIENDLNNDLLSWKRASFQESKIRGQTKMSYDPKDESHLSTFSVVDEKDITASCDDVVLSNKPERSLAPNISIPQVQLQSKKSSTTNKDSESISAEMTHNIPRSQVTSETNSFFNKDNKTIILNSCSLDLQLVSPNRPPKKTSGAKVDISPDHLVFTISHSCMLEETQDSFPTVNALKEENHLKDRPTSRLRMTRLASTSSDASFLSSSTVRTSSFIYDSDYEGSMGFEQEIQDAHKSDKVGHQQDSGIDLHCRGGVKNITYDDKTKTVTDKTKQNKKVHKFKGISRTKEHRKPKDIRAAKLLFLMFGVFIVCWFPVALMHLFTQIYNLNPRSVYIMSLLGHSNSLFNFFVYPMRMHSFRVALRKTIPFLRRFVKERPGGTDGTKVDD